MPEFSVGEAADLLGVSPDTLRRWVDSGRLPASKSSGGRRVVGGAELAKLALSLVEEQRPAGPPASARNRLTGLVTRVTRDKVMAQVELVCGPYRIVSLISAEAAEELGLEPGVLAVASMKATNVTIELPAS